MDIALYLLPVTLGNTPLNNVLPQYNAEVISGIRHFIVEDVRSARRFLRSVDAQFDIDSPQCRPAKYACSAQKTASHQDRKSVV